MMNRGRFVSWLAGMTLLGGAVFARAPRTDEIFRVVAVPTSDKGTVQVRLSVTNVSRQDQLFWAATDYCTNQHWKADDPNVRLYDGSRNARKSCGETCIHHVTLRPGETHTVTLPLEIFPHARTGRRLIRFANLQPPQEYVDRMAPNSSPPTKIYPPRIFWSAPVAVDLRKAG